MNRVAQTLLLVACVAAATPAAAADKTYTIQQLKVLVDAGKFPPQAEPTQKTDSLEFVPCKAMVRQTVRDVAANYPTRTLLDTPQMLSMKIWTNDGAIVMSCSQDGKFVMQQSKYR